jgi:hypothetical protein
MRKPSANILRRTSVVDKIEAVCIGCDAHQREDVIAGVATYEFQCLHDEKQH